MSDLFAIFHNESDGCTYSTRVLLGLFLTSEDAEPALLEYIQRAEEYTRINESFDQKISGCHSRIWAIKLERDTPKNFGNDKQRQKAAEKKTTEPLAFDMECHKLNTLVEEKRVWMESIGDEIPDPNINNYEIRPVELGVIRTEL